MRNKVQISILIANWNTRDLLRNCLHSILDHNCQLELETIVIDNDSGDGSVAMVREEFAWVNLVDCQHNLGFGRASNWALELARGENLLLLNPDTVIQPGAIQGLLEFLDRNPKVGAVGPRLLNPNGSLQVSCSPRPTIGREAWRLFHLDELHPISKYPSRIFTAGKPVEVDVLLGACILLRRPVIEQVGLFDEQFFVYSEEVDLCLRIQQAGWHIFWLPTVEVIHYGGQSTRQAADQMFLELYRNKVKYFRKHSGRNTVQLYKALLFGASLTRILFGSLLGNLPYGREHRWKVIASQYEKLLYELPNF